MTIIGVVAGQSGQMTGLFRAYIDAVLLAGGTPVIIPAADYRPGQLEDVLDKLDGLLLSGGSDVDPRSYGASRQATLDGVDLDRDATELRAIAWAREEGKRILGICRGAQILAVATGGTLFQDLPAAGFDDHVDSRYDGQYATLMHTIKVTPDTLVADATGGLTEVNSHHHQAVDSPGDVLIPTAITSDGVIEALEGPDILALQWHPEFLISTDPRHLLPFKWLVGGERALRS